MHLPAQSSYGDGETPSSGHHKYEDHRAVPPNTPERYITEGVLRLSLDRGLDSLRFAMMGIDGLVHHVVDHFRRHPNRMFSYVARCNLCGRLGMLHGRCHGMDLDMSYIHMSEDSEY